MASRKLEDSQNPVPPVVFGLSNLSLAQQTCFDSGSILWTLQWYIAWNTMEEISETCQQEDIGVLCRRVEERARCAVEDVDGR
jgi:hypothetical protein